MNLRKKATEIKKELKALRIAVRENLVPWYVKVLIFIAVAYALSPIDLIPDFIPVLGLLDDLLLLPLFIYIILKLIPKETMEECRKKAETAEFSTKRNWIAGGIVILLWLLLGLGLYTWFQNRE